MSVHKRLRRIAHHLRMSHPADRVEQHPDGGFWCTACGRWLGYSTVTPLVGPGQRGKRTHAAAPPW